MMNTMKSNFDLGAVSRAYDAVNYHVTNRLRQRLCKKHRVRGPGYSRYPDIYPIQLHSTQTIQLRQSTFERGSRCPSISSSFESTFERGSRCPSISSTFEHSRSSL